MLSFRHFNLFAEVQSAEYRPNKSSDSYYYEYIRKVLSAAKLSGRFLFAKVLKFFLILSYYYSVRGKLGSVKSPVTPGVTGAVRL